MTRIRTLKTNFTAGEVSPGLLGRGDLTAFVNGAARLRNVFIHPTGGITRRPGTRYVATARGRVDRVTAGVTPTAPNGGTAADAIDDDPDTVLATTTAIGTTDPYVVVEYDLGTPQPVLFADAIGLRLTAGDSDGEFRIQHSDDGSAWTDLGTPTNVGSRAEGFRRTGSVTARYWRLARVGGTDLGAATIELADFTLWADAGTVSPGRAIAFEFNTEQTYLLVVTDRNIAVYADDALIADLPSPVAADQIGRIVWAQSADTLLIVHPDIAPQRFTRTTVTTGGGTVEDWKLSYWQFVLEDSKDSNDNPLGTALRQPYHKFADAEVTLTPSGTALDSSITLTASAAVFQATHVGLRFRIEERQVEITGVSSPTVASATVKETLKSTDPVKDWEEPALSTLRGWPASVVFHQDRLVIGGSRDLPNRLWLSKSGDLFNFDLGEGLDDAAIEFAILSDQVNAVRNVFSGRHLQVLTSGAEWMVTGDPLTPENIQLKRQTRVGSPIDRNVPPRDVDGATLFAARNGRELREFLYADVEQAYQANDLALLARHIVAGPQDQDYDQGRRLFHVVMADGTLATVTVYRAERVTAWSLQTTDGQFRSICVVDDTVYLLVERSGGVFIERFDDALTTDAALTGQSGTPQDDWSGLDHLEGATVAVAADGAVAPDATVAGGTITLATPAETIEAGLRFTMEVEPLPPAIVGPRGSAQGSPIRLVEATFRLLDAKTLRVDTGGGYRELPFRHIGETGVLDTGPVSFTGDLAVRALGWQRSADPLWRIAQSAPLPCTILSVATEIKIND